MTEHRDESQHDAPPMSHADALGAYDDTVDPMPPDLPDRILGGDAMGRAIAEAEDRRSYREAVANGWPITSKAGVPVPPVDEEPPPRPPSLLRELLGDGPQRQSDFALWPPTRPFGDGGATVRQGDTLPTIPQRPRLSFDWNDYGQHDDAAREAIDRVIAAIRAEDARARSLLPDPPPGWEWDGELVTRESGAGVGAEVTARIVYRLREVTP